MPDDSQRQARGKFEPPSFIPPSQAQIPVSAPDLSDDPSLLPSSRNSANLVPFVNEAGNQMPQAEQEASIDSVENYPTNPHLVVPQPQEPVYIPPPAQQYAASPPPGQFSALPPRNQYPPFSAPGGTTRQTLPPPPANPGISRRTLIIGVAALAGIGLVGGGVTLLLLNQQSQPGPVTTNITPSSNATQPGISPTAQTTTPGTTTTPSADPTATPTVGTTPTPTPRPTPTNTPTPTPTPSPTPNPIVTSGKATIAEGTLFNFDTGQDLKTGTGDVLWQVSPSPSTIRLLIPEASARIVNLGKMNYAQYTAITPANLHSYVYGVAPINGNNDATNQLVVGDVFAVLTNGGNHAKAQVTVYGTSLQINWVTYKG